MCSRVTFAVVIGALMAVATAGEGQQPLPSVQQPIATGQQRSPSGLPIPQQPPAALLSALLERYKPVTAERLKTPEDTDWLMVRRTYDGWGYSPLDQITPGNVGRLRPVWLMSTG